ncbi:hypothetical protein OsI_08763 [Oryza sativa Indica Group]|uniref:RIN4 pathogenic type III effector avirulence factor Avr cleavage site domain-containing protein n=1 Tax=Oryza sativa subsp. indica TaxID=39946 RepID=B8AHQ3_ORYSI|nr:hypothetical protein OsI_08763 [Oryza sativa Indica Group]
MPTPTPAAAGPPDETGRTIPKFGAWDVNNPASADGFTVIFSKARDEKKGPVNVDASTRRSGFAVCRPAPPNLEEAKEYQI